MISLARLKLEVLAGVRYHRRALLAFHLYFALLLLAVFAPASAWLLSGLVSLSGASIVGNEDLIAFAFTPAGLLWLLTSATLAALIVFFQHAGMMLICSRDRAGRYHTAARALWHVVLRSKGLLLLAALQVAVHLLFAIPVLLALGWAFQYFLGGYDIYFVLSAYPPEFWQFIACLVAALGWLLVVHGNLYVRWSMALPVMLLEGAGALAALRRSAVLTLGTRKRIAGTLLSVAAVVALLPLLVSLLFDAVGWALFSVLPGSERWIAGAVLVLLLSYALANLLAGFLAVSANSLTMLKLYSQYCGRTKTLSSINEPRNTGVFAVGIEAVVVIFALVQVGFALHYFQPQQEALNIAHRGNSWDAPENTLAAIERAIIDGADYIELDVRHTADGELVLLHDRDLLRIAGDHRPIWEINYSELADVDVGSWFGPEFASERLPTLAQAVDIMRGRAGLYLEVKGASQMPDLVPMVVAELERLDFVAETIFASLAFSDIQQAQQLAPNLRTSLLVHTSVGRLAGQRVDMLALRAAIATPSTLRQIHHAEQSVHVWTLNDKESMQRALDLGVDGIITDRPDVLREVLLAREEMSTVERWLLRFRYRLW